MKQLDCKNGILSTVLDIIGAADSDMNYVSGSIQESLIENVRNVALSISGERNPRNGRILSGGEVVVNKDTNGNPVSIDISKGVGVTSNGNVIVFPKADGVSIGDNIFAYTVEEYKQSHKTKSTMSMYGGTDILVTIDNESISYGSYPSDKKYHGETVLIYSKDIDVPSGIAGIEGGETEVDSIIVEDIDGGNLVITTVDIPSIKITGSLTTQKMKTSGVKASESANLDNIVTTVINNSGKITSNCVNTGIFKSDGGVYASNEISGANTTGGDTVSVDILTKDFVVSGDIKTDYFTVEGSVKTEDIIISETYSDSMGVSGYGSTGVLKANNFISSQEASTPLLGIIFGPVYSASYNAGGIEYLPCDGRDAPDSYIDKLLNGAYNYNVATGMSKLPDLSTDGRFPICASPTGLLAVGDSITKNQTLQTGAVMGENHVTLDVGSIPSHKHIQNNTVILKTAEASGENCYTNPSFTHNDYTTDSSDATYGPKGDSHDNRPPYKMFTFLMRVK